MDRLKAITAALSAAALCAGVCVHATETGATNGLVATRPAEGRSVATAHGHMVPYTTTIPGTNVEFTMVPIPGGTFLMGSPDDEEGRGDDEGPQVEVTVQPFWMGQCEVTWAEYHEFMKLCNVFEAFENQGIRPVTPENLVDAVTAPSKLYDPGFTYEPGDDDEQPAVSMSQFGAKQYTKWLSLLTGEFYRLPSEAEWEYACRAGTTTAYWFGDDPEELTKYGWPLDSTDWVTSKVGQKPPNAWGLYDMHGNVWEWTLDQYEEAHHAKFAGRRVTAEEVLNWPTTVYPRALRGGSWESEPEQCRSAARLASDDDEWRRYDPNVPKSPWWTASEEGQTIGFRIVRPLHPPQADERPKYWDADVAEIQEHADRRIDKEGKGERGLVDPDLPTAIEQIKSEIPQELPKE